MDWILLHVHFIFTFLLHIIILSLLHFKRKTTYPQLNGLIFCVVNYYTKYLHVNIFLTVWLPNFFHTSFFSLLFLSNVVFLWIYRMCFLNCLLNSTLLVMYLEALPHCIFILKLHFTSDCTKTASYIPDYVVDVCSSLIDLLIDWLVCWLVCYFLKIKTQSLFIWENNLFPYSIFWRVLVCDISKTELNWMHCVLCVILISLLCVPWQQDGSIMLYPIVFL